MALGVLLPGVEIDGADRRPVAGPLAPALGVLPAGHLVDLVPALQDVVLAAVVAVVGGDEAQGAVQVLAVVLGDEGIDPGAGIVEAGEGAVGEVGAVLDGAEEGLGVGIVVAFSGAVEGGDDTELLQGGQQSRALTSGIGDSFPA